MSIGKIIAGVAVVGAVAFLVKKVGATSVLNAVAGIASATVQTSATTVEVKKKKEAVKQSPLQGAMSAAEKEHDRVEVRVKGDKVNVTHVEVRAKEANPNGFDKLTCAKMKGHGDDGYAPLRIVK